jgi:hypothetical protein
MVMAGPMRASAQPAIITISEASGVPISSGLYGINYDWNVVPAEEFPAFAAAMAQVAHYKLARFPGGWNAEHYNWSDNTETWKKAPDQPGVAPGVFIAAVPHTSFITPSETAIADPAQGPATVEQTLGLVSSYGDSVRDWEIGNEWWLQNGAAKSADKRELNLRNYAALLKAVVPAMKAENPDITIFATADWTNPQDIVTLRQLTGAAAWSRIDGISVHAYCGTVNPGRLCSAIPGMLAQVRAASGKKLIYVSEWAVAERLSADDYGIKNAGDTIEAIQQFAFANVAAGAYWPPVKTLPAIAFISAGYTTPFATGIAFGWMATYYQGMALHTAGPLPAVAARDGGSTTVIIPTETNGTQNVWIALAGTGLHQVLSAEVMYSAQPDDPKAGRLVTIANLPIEMVTDPNGRPYVAMTLNPGTAGRGKGFEIARVTIE